MCRTAICRRPSPKQVSVVVLLCSNPFQSPGHLIRVGPTVQFTSVHRFAASSPLAGSPTTFLLGSGPPSSSLRYTASRPLHRWPVPPPFLLGSGPPSSSLRYTASRPLHRWPVPPPIK